jgi:hypothetical protein
MAEADNGFTMIITNNVKDTYLYALIKYKKEQVVE